MTIPALPASGSTDWYAWATAIDSAARAYTATSSQSSWLSQFDKAMVNRATTPVKVLAIGDSITEGQGADFKQYRWLDLLRTSLLATNPLPVAGGEGYRPAEYAVYAPDSGWGTWWSNTTGTIGFSAATGDLGYRTVYMNNGATITYPFYGTDLDIWYMKETTSGSFTVQIDGGTLSSAVNTTGAHSIGNVYAAARGLTAGWHTVKIAASGTVTYIEGLTIYNGDLNVGIQLYDSAHAGAKTTDFTGLISDMTAAWTAVAPDLVIINLGVNDFGNSISASTVATNITTIVTALQGLAKIPSILLVANYVYYGVTGTTWAPYVSAIQGVATAKNTGFLDLTKIMPAADASGTGNYLVDGIHPNDTGHVLMANLVGATVNKRHQTIVSPTANPVALASETFTGTTGASWPGQWTTVAGTTSIQSNAGQITSGASTYASARADLTGMTAVGDCAVTGTVSGVVAAVEQYASIALGGDAGGTWLNPANGIAVQLNYNATAASSSVSLVYNSITLASANKTLTGTTTYNFKLKRVGSVVMVKVWTGTEPYDWDAITNALATPTTGIVSLGAGSGAAAVARSFNFDNIVVTDR